MTFEFVSVMNLCCKTMYLVEGDPAHAQHFIIKKVQKNS